MKKIATQSGSKDSLWPKPRGDKREEVLYVEDDDDNYLVAELALSDAYHLHRARDAEETCRLLKERGQDLSAILMDIELRGSALNGIDLTQLVRGNLVRRSLPAYTSGIPVLQIPIIFVTAHNAKYPDAILMRAGGDRVITKPVDFAQLTLALTQLHLSRMQRRRS
jgi:CheY-like chemotaxis protein